MEIRKSSLDVMFEGRIEEIARLTIPEKNRLLKIEEIKSIEDYIDDLSEEQEQQAKEFIDDLMSDFLEETSQQNQKYYCFGFSDGLFAAIESCNLRPEIERRFKNDK